MYVSDDKTSDEIIRSYSKKRWVILAAQMQSGKTGTYIALAEKMKNMGLIDSVIVISSYNSVSLREQTRSRLKEHISNARVWFHPELLRLSRSLPIIDIRLVKMLRRCLLIIDESHIGTSIDSMIHKFLNITGISGNGYINPILYPNNDLYILSVSATPYAEIASIPQLKLSYKDIVYHVPGEGYRGLSDMNLHQIDYDNKESQLYEILEKYKDTRSYGIIRQGKTFKDRAKNPNAYIFDTVESFCNENDAEYLLCDQNNYRLENILYQEPEKFTIILIKDYCKAGQTIHKEYISFVYETYKKTDAQAQGLPGRCCGYDNTNNEYDIDIYCNKEILETHIKWIENIDTDPYDIPSLGYNITSARRDVKNKCIFLHHNHISIDPQIIVHPIPDEMIDRHDDIINMCSYKVMFNKSIHFVLQSEYDNKSYLDDYEKLKSRTIDECKWLFTTSPSLESILEPICSKKNNMTSIVFTTQQELVIYIVEQVCPDYESRATGTYIESQEIVKQLWTYKTPITACLSKFRHNYCTNKISGINIYYYN